MELRERIKERSKQYYEANKKKAKQYKKQYYEANKERIKERSKQYSEANKERIKERSKQYYEANKERSKQYREANKEKIKQYREANKEKTKQYKKQYYEANKERRKERDKQYREANKERIKERDKQYREANKEKIKQYREANKEKIKQYRERKNKIINRIKQVGINFQTYCIIEEELKTKNGWTKEEFYKIYPTIQDYYEKFYNNKYWIVKSIIVLEREQRKCRDCKEYASEVHHPKHPYWHPKLALADSNLVPLCSDCHQIRHNKRQIEDQKRKIRFK